MKSFRITAVKLFSVVLAAAILFSNIGLLNALAEKNSVEFEGYANSSFNEQDYINYKKSFENKNSGEDKVFLSPENYVTELSKGVELIPGINKEKSKALFTDEESTAYWNFEIKNSGKYNITVNYYPAKGNVGSIKRRLLLDKNVPFRNVNSIEFTRIFKDSGETSEDVQGNQIRPDTVEVNSVQSMVLSDLGGYTEENYGFYLEKGKHTLGLEALMGKLTIESIEISFIPCKESYSTVKADYLKTENLPKECFIKKQAEDYSFKSNESILTQNDRTSAATEPYTSYKIIYNTVGATSWSDAGQWIEWEIDVPQDGLYTLGGRWRQNTKLGGTSSRILSIDGKIPFNEAACLTFKYSNSWQVNRFGEEDEAYLFYLKKGKHTIRFTVNYGKMAEILAETSDIISNLNEIYLNIIMITGASPDLKRDYNFSAQIPDTIKNFDILAGRIEKLIDKTEVITGKGQNTSEMKRVVNTLRLMYKDPESIAKRLTNFQSNISSLATWLSDNQKQPLEIDYLFLASESANLPKASGSFFDSLILQFKQLLGSYVMDYTTIGNVSGFQKQKEAITVWMTCGTEQANIVQRMINEDFIPQKSISVKAQNVSLGALMPALLAGRGPDVMLNMDEATPVNYALRGAVYDLSSFEDIKKELARFNSSTYESFCFDDGVYALPTTVDYPVLFYRNDVIEQLQIEKSDLNTWDNVLQVVLPKIQTKNLYFGLTASMNSYLMFYYQAGGKLYDNETNLITLESKESVNAFEEYTSIYREYKQKLTFSFVNLFRSGEMPIAVMPYSQYFQLAVFAPEIEGLWNILPVPGTVTANGIDRSVATTVTGAAIMSDSKNPHNAWEFLKWWTGDSSQIRYANEVETLLGIAGRVNVADNTARQTIDWSTNVRNVLDEQLQHSRGVPQVPGSYYASRYFDFAFRDVVYSGQDSIRALISATEDINEEIKEKKKELLK